MRLIDADELRDAIYYKDNYNNDIINNFFDEVDFAPTIDAKPVVHAHWEDDGSGHDDMICSHCGEPPATDEDGWTFDALKNWWSEYCPNCGAKMDEEVK